ncbi:MAG: M28 family peptidase [Pyrinomonadaceae bacterium]|nr:M28 family peptidase [Pyrinomonadaceae bacterium]
MKIKQSNRPLASRILKGMLLLLVLCSVALSLLKVEARKPGDDSSVTPSALQNPALVRRFQQAITPDALAAHLYYLASDMFEGRETSARGQKLAADYLAAQYRRMGLMPKGTVKTDDQLALKSYFQPFKLYKKDAKSTKLELRINGQLVAESLFSPEAQDDSSYFAFGKVAAAKGGVVFAGYGIEDAALGYRDFSALKEKQVSVDGKWVMILADEPLRDAATSLLPTPERKPSKWSSRGMFNKKLAVWNAGRPAGVLVIGDAGPRAPEGGFIEQAKRAATAARGIGNLALYQPAMNPFPPTYIISTKLADRILSASGRTVKDLALAINGSLKPQVFDVKGAELISNAEAFPPLETENVLGFIEGSDPKLKDEVVVISAHYDHLGMNPGLKGDQIYNGAADDGSGTVATLVIAETFMRAKAEGMGPRRSILFLNTSGEEKGTLGSAFYTDSQPVIPIERIVADINMDGIGGVDAAHAKTNPNYIYIIGQKETSSELLEMARQLNRLTGTNLLLDDSKNFPSDQRNFEKLLVPYIYYSTGLTEHYHQPSDEPQTINYEHMAQVARLAFASAWQVANADAPPSRTARDHLVVKGYTCPPCTLECDALLFDSPGFCPVCEMPLAPKYEVKK